MSNKTDTLAIEMGLRIAARRKQLGLTQEQAAERAGLSQQFFATVETGGKNIRAESVVKVSRALNVSTDFLLLGTVTDQDSNRLFQMLKSLDEEQFVLIENIIQNILKFGGYE